MPRDRVAGGRISHTLTTPPSPPSPPSPFRCPRRYFAELLWPTSATHPLPQGLPVVFTARPTALPTAANQCWLSAGSVYLEAAAPADVPWVVRTMGAPARAPEGAIIGWTNGTSLDDLPGGAGRLPAAALQRLFLNSTAAVREMAWASHVDESLLPPPSTGLLRDGLLAEPDYGPCGAILQPHEGAEADAAAPRPRSCYFRAGPKSMMPASLGHGNVSGELALARAPVGGAAPGPGVLGGPPQVRAAALFPRGRGTVVCSCCARQCPPGDPLLAWPSTMAGLPLPSWHHVQVSRPL